MPKRRRRERGGATLLCRKCRTPTRVLKTTRDDKNVVQRERICPKCGTEVHSVEKVMKP